MLALMVIAFVVGGVIALISVGVQQSISEKIECPKCGKEFKLVGGSYKCSKCKTRITKTKEGEITY